MLELEMPVGVKILAVTTGVSGHGEVGEGVTSQH